MTQHEPWHPDAFLQNRYTRAYRAVVERAQSENRSRVVGEHAEHHIVPESFFIARSRPGPPGWLPGDPDDPTNLVLLTHKEHAWCHILLSRRTTWGRGKAKMGLAVAQVLGSLEAAGKPHRLSSRLWASIMQAAAEAAREALVEAWARPEVKQRHREAQIAAHARPETKQKHREALIAANARPEVRQKKREASIANNARPEIKQKLREARIAAHARPETKQKHREATVAAVARPEIKQKLREGVISARARPEVKQKHRETNARPETKQKRRESASAAHARPETKQKVREAARATNARPEVKAKRRATWRAKSDPTVRHWQHQDGRTFTGTRWELEEWAGLPTGSLRRLTSPKPQRTRLGWRIVQDVLAPTVTDPFAQNA